MTHPVIPASEPDAGITLVHSQERWWAWFGVELLAAADLTQLQKFRELDRATALRTLLDADRGYLGSQLGGDCAIELRWISDPKRALVSLFMLGQLCAPTKDLALTAATAARRRMAALPDHVQARELSSTADLSAALRPTKGLDISVAELRKRWIVERAQREDAPWPFYVSSPWLREVPEVGWSGVLKTMAQSPIPLILSIGLQPEQVPHWLPPVISEQAAVYRRLSEPGQSTGYGLYHDPIELAPDPGALTAGQLFEDAGQRYQDRAFRFRVSVAAAGELPAGFVTQIREVMSPAESAEERGFRSAALSGAALTEVFAQHPQ